MAEPPTDNDLLLPFEQKELPSKYKEYYRTKRNNFFASIQNLPELWNYYQKLDQIWLHEIDLLKPARRESAFPILLYINAHAKMRIAIELALSACIAEARSILRDAVEFVAHAHHMLNDPAHQIAWLNKLDDEKAFKKEFWDRKAKVLFAGLDELYKVWAELSESGSHANITSMCERFRSVDVEDNQIEWRIRYTGMDEKPLAMGTFVMLLICFKMEETLFKDYQLRLQFDEKLLRMRAEFEIYKEQLRQFLIEKYKVERPEDPLIVLK